jgi:hypothetical protein
MMACVCWLSREKMNRNLVWLILIVFAAVFVRAEASLAQKVEDAIRAAEPDWQWTHPILDSSPIVPSEKRLLISRWKHTSRTGKVEAIDLHIFQVDSRHDAEMSLAPEREGKVASGWKVNRYSLGDEAYLATYGKDQRYEMHFRRGIVVVIVKGDSIQLVERFAKYAAKQIAAE